MIDTAKAKKKNSYKVQAIILSFLLVLFQIPLTHADISQPANDPTTTFQPVSIFRPPVQIVRPAATSGTVVSPVSPPTAVASPTTILMINQDPDTNPAGPSDSSFLQQQTTSPLSQPSQSNTVFDTPITNSFQTPSSASNIFIPNQPVNTTIQQPAAVGTTSTIITPPADTVSNPSTPSAPVDGDDIVSPPVSGATPTDTTDPPASTPQDPPQGNQPPIDTTTQEPRGSITPPPDETPGSSPPPPQTGGDPDLNDIPLLPVTPLPPNTGPGPNAEPPVIPFLGDPFGNRSQNNNERSQGGGSGPSGPFLGDSTQPSNPYAPRDGISDDRSRFVGGGLEAGLRILGLLLKGKGKAQIKKNVSQSEKIQREEEVNKNSSDKSVKSNYEKKKKNPRWLFKKFGKNQKKQAGGDQIEEELEQAGIDTDSSDLEQLTVDQDIDHAQDTSKQGPFMEVFSDLIPPVYGLKSNDIIPTDPMNIQVQKPQRVHSSPLKRAVENVLMPKNPYQTVQVAKMMLPSMIHRIHKIASSDESGIHIENGSNLGDVDQ